MPESKLRLRHYKIFDVETLPCIWCGRRLRATEADCTNEHIICSCIIELRSNSLDNCKVACKKCNELRNSLSTPELYTYRFWNILLGKREEIGCDKPILDKYLAECKEQKIKVTPQSLYSYMKRNKTMVTDRETIDRFVKNQYHRYYMQKLGELLGIEVTYDDFQEANEVVQGNSAKAA